MTNYKAIPLVLALAVALFSPIDAVAKAGRDAKSVRGTASGTISINPATGAFTGNTTGVSTHLGKHTVQVKGTGAPTQDGGFAGSGRVTIVTAKGDRLTGKFTLTTSGHTTTVEVKITGGTGRFKNARGTLTVICVTGDPALAGENLVSEIECKIKGRLRY